MYGSHSSNYDIIRFVIMSLAALGCGESATAPSPDGGGDERPEPTMDAGPGRDAAPSSDAGPSEDLAVAEDDAGPACLDLAYPHVAIEWTDIDATPGCFFFSSPTGGAEFYLGERGRLMDGTLVFEDGSSFSLDGRSMDAMPTGYERTLGCPSGDNEWYVVEHFEGTWMDWPEPGDCSDARPVFSGTYTYGECSTTPGGTCVASDGCSISATVTIRVVHESELPPRPTVPDAETVMETCRASCDARASVEKADGTPCTAPNPACIDSCIADVGHPECGGEEFAYYDCVASEPNALLCIDPISLIVLDAGGPCVAASREARGCMTAHEPRDCAVR